MIVVRNVFRLQFGKAREVKALWNEWKSTRGIMPGARAFRALTDLTGESYSFVLELEFDDLTSYEAEQNRLFANPEWRTFYSKLTPLITSGYREIYTVVDAGTADNATVSAAGAARAVTA